MRRALAVAAVAAVAYVGHAALATHPASDSGSAAAGMGLSVVSQGNPHDCVPPAVPRQNANTAYFRWTPGSVINQHGVVRNPAGLTYPFWGDFELQVHAWRWDTAHWHLAAAWESQNTVPGQKVCARGLPMGWRGHGSPMVSVDNRNTAEPMVWAWAKFERGPETPALLAEAVRSHGLDGSPVLPCNPRDDCIGGLRMSYGWPHPHGASYCPAVRGPGAAGTWNARTGGRGVLAGSPVVLARHNWGRVSWAPKGLSEGFAWATVGWPVPPGTRLAGGRYQVWAADWWAGTYNQCIPGMPHIAWAGGREYVAVNVPRVGAWHNGTFRWQRSLTAASRPGESASLQWVWVRLSHDPRGGGRG